MDWTDRHCRFFMRLLAPSAELYTEMVTAAAIRHGDVDRLLAFDASEHPVALQVGGSDPDLMAEAARIGEARGYDEININVGCPSDRVQSGAFGACLMATPQVVADCIVAMRSAVSVPVTVKTRIGIDDKDSYEYLLNFVDIVGAAGCEEFIVHARIAILAGLSPKENRSVPPLNYERVYRLKRERANFKIAINGGIGTVEEAKEHLKHVDSVMIGRQAYQSPWLLTELEKEFGTDAHTVPESRMAAVQALLPYVEQQLANGAELKHISRHLLGLFAGQPGARAWRRYLSEHAHLPGAGIEVLELALQRLAQAA